MVTKKEEQECLQQAVQSLKAGMPVIAPCDTIYGFLGIVPQCDSEIRAVKGREEIKPFLRLISSADLSSITDIEIPAWVNQYWPGPLTVIVPFKEGQSDPTGTASVALRYPDDPWLCELVEKSGGMLYSTSVNRAGNPPMNHIDRIIAEFGDEVPLIIDGGEIDGLPSTIVDLSSSPCRVLRQGAVEIPEEYLG